MTSFIWFQNRFMPRRIGELSFLAEPSFFCLEACPSATSRAVEKEGASLRLEEGVMTTSVWVGDGTSFGGGTGLRFTNNCASHFSKSQGQDELDPSCIAFFAFKALDLAI